MSKTIDPKARKFKLGTTVQFVRRNGVVATGRVVGNDVKGSGAWVSVNTAPRGQNPEVTVIRPSQASVIA